MSQRLILASTSPQRKKLLEGIGVTFEIVAPSVDEDAHPERHPHVRARILAQLKAEDVAKRFPGRFVLGADTLVVSGNRTLLEKPVDEADARRMLALQSGTTSVVHSAVCLIDPAGKDHMGIDTSYFTLRKMSPADIDWWIGANLWQGRSGGVQVDGLGQLMMQHIQGDWTGIVGLPIYLFGELAKEAGLLLR